MDQMIPADRGEIAVAGVDHDVQLGISQLQPGGKWNRASVRRVKRVELHIARDAPGATDPRHQRQRLEIDLRINERAREGVYRGADTAAWAPDVRHAVAAQEWLYGIGSVVGRVTQNVQHRLASTIAFRISSGLCTPPPACDTAKVFAFPLAARSTSRTICPRLSSGTTNA